MQDSRWALTRVEQRGRILSLDLLATLLLIQPRIWLALWAANTHCVFLFLLNKSRLNKSVLNSHDLICVKINP